MDRAYSLLTVKSFDEDQRVLIGLATSPTPDRMDDIVESRGAEFQLPMPLLWQHDPRQPIGHVTEARVSDDGITITAKLAKIEEPGNLQARLHEAWQSIKSGLVRGLSIGFKPIDIEPIKGSFGMRVKKWLWVETSAVTIPANADASIQLIKSLDTAPATAGMGADVSSRTPPAAAGTRRVVVTTTRGGHMKKTIADQIKDFEATRQAKSARMTEMMEQAGEKNETFDDAQTEEYDNLAAEVKAIDAHLVRLAELEKANKAAARPVNGDNADAGAQSRGTMPVIQIRDQLPPGIKFARMIMCKAAAYRDQTDPLRVAKARYPGDTDLHTVLSVSTGELQTMMKAAVNAGTTTDSTWAGPLVQYTNFMGDFVEFLRPQTIIGKFGTGNIPSLRRIPFNVRIAGQTSGGTGYWVGEGQPKPVTKFDFDTRTLQWTKVAAICVLTEELIRFSSPSAEALVRQALADALIARIDTDFIDPSHAATSGVSPASITNGLTALTPTGTGDADDIRADIRAIFAPFLVANLTPTNGVWIMSHTTALAVSLLQNGLGESEFPGLTMNGGTLNGLPVITSQYASLAGSPRNELVILANASDIYLADDGQATVDVSREASLQMADNPTVSVGTGSPLAPVATSLVSLWQTDSVGVRAERMVNWAKRRTQAVAYLQNVAWGTA